MTRMNSALGLLSLIVLLIAAPAAYPQASVKLVWDPPATYTDGTPVQPGDIQAYYVYSGATSDAINTFEATVDAPTTEFPLPAALYGRWLAVTAEANGTESAQSVPVQWVAPEVPQNLRIEIVISTP